MKWYNLIVFTFLDLQTCTDNPNSLWMAMLSVAYRNAPQQSRSKCTATGTAKHLLGLQDVLPEIGIET